MRGRVGDIKYEEDRYTKDDKELFSSRQRVDLNVLLRRADKEKLEDKRKSMLVISGVLLVAAIVLLLVSF